MKPYKINITIMSRNEEAEILDKQILVDNLEDLNKAEFHIPNGDTIGIIANKQIYVLVKEALENEKEDGLDIVEEYDETPEDLTEKSPLNNPANFAN